jgi:serine/threonine protein kinase/tetratricopeptide (TPR) repeat protein/WD40 repeat protein
MINERSLFMQALEIDDLAQRERLLERECGDDLELRQRIERLLSAHAAAGGILDQPAVEPQGTDAFQPLTESVGTVIGPFKLIQQIGEGGMGVVYMAQQTEPMKRLVALKIIKPGMDTRQVIARFEAERQTLAMMDHPNIAKVLDAGTTESGRPFFVMELVKGVPITQYCDTKKLTTRQRLELLLPVCNAVQHAHQKGVIHRDLKPSNVLIALYDGQPVPKVIDFGVAKATGGQLTEKTLVTGFGSLVGTLEYMSPEQAELNQLDVDTRSDIYSLGVLMYELLTGTTPIDRQRLRTAAFTEMLRIIREEEPPLPSTRLGTSDSLASVAANRQIEPAKLSRLVRGEVDWIVMKALEKDRNRRYETANGLAQDIRRYLNDEAIIARPTSAWYRLKKVIHRNRAAAGLISTIGVVLLLGSTISTWLAIRESRANNLARQSLIEADQQRQQALTAKTDAERQRERAEKATQDEAAQRKLAQEREAEAESAKIAELEQRQAAEQERDRANAANVEIARQKEQQRRALYAAQMNLISRAWDSNNITRVRELLNASRPQPGETDLRGFEWNYWLRMLHASERELQLPVNTLQMAARAQSAISTDTSSWTMFSRDGKYLAAADTTVATANQSQRAVLLMRVWEVESGKKLFERELASLLFDRPAFSRPTPTLLNSTFAFSAISAALVHVDSQRVAVVLMRRGGRSSSSIFGDRITEPTAVLHVYKTESGEEILSRTAENYVNGRATFAFSHDGSRFATPLKEPFIQVCDSQSGEEITRVDIPQRDDDLRGSETFALDASGRRLAVKPGISLFDITLSRQLAGDLRQPVVAPFGITIYDLEGITQVTTPPVLGQHLEFSHDGQKIVAVDRNEPRNIEPLATAFDTVTGQALMSLAKPDFKTRPGQSVESGYHSLSPNGEWFAVTLPTRSDLATIQLWNTITGKPGPKFQGPTQALVALGFTSDGRQVRAVYEDGKVRFWGVPAQAPAIQTTVPTTGPVGLSGTTEEQSFGERPAITVSPDGRWTAENLRTLATSATQNRTFPNYGESTLVKDNHGQLADRTFRFESALGLGPPRFSANGAYLAWTGVDESAEQNQACELRVWEVSSGREVVAKRMPALESTSPQSRFLSTLVWPGVFSVDCRRFAIAVPDAPTLNVNSGHSIHVWDLTDGRQLHPRVGIDAMRIPSPLSGVSFTQNGELLSASSPVFALASRGAPVNPSRPLPSTLQDAIQGASGTRIWNVSDGKLVFEDADADLAIPCEDGSRVAGLFWASEGGGLQIVNWETSTRREISRFSLPSDRLPQVIVVNTDGRRLAVALGSNVHVYDTDSGRELFQLAADSAAVRAVAFNADASRIVTATGTLRQRPSNPVSAQPAEEQREVRVWDAHTGQELLSLTGNYAGMINSTVIDGGALQLSTHSLSMQGGTTWNASPLPPALEAAELVNWLDVRDEDGHIRTLENVSERLNFASTSQEVRRLALELVRQRRNPVDLLTQASDLLLGESPSRKPYERALALIVEAKKLATIDVPSSYLETWAHYRLGDWNAAAQSLSTLPSDTVLPAEVHALQSIVQHHWGEREKALESLRQTYLAASANESHWRQLLAAAEEALAMPKAADEPEKWLGQQFMPRFRDQLFFSADGRRASGGSPPYRVTRVEGDRLWIGEHYIDRKEVVPLAEAPAYYTNVLVYQNAISRPLAPGTQEVSRPSSQTMSQTIEYWLNSRAASWRFLGESMKAIADYKSASKLQPDNATSHVNIAVVYVNDLEEYDQALVEIDEAIRLKNSIAQYHELRGYILRRQGQMDEALKSFDEAIRLDPKRGYSYCQRAYVWSAKGDREKMLQDLDEGIRLSPDEASTWYARAWLLATSSIPEHRDGNKAIEAATKACELAFWKSPAYLGALAAAYAETGNFPEAVMWQEKSLEIANRVPEKQRADYETRLALYREGKPYYVPPVAIQE